MSQIYICKSARFQDNAYLEIWEKHYVNFRRDTQRQTR